MPPDLSTPFKELTYHLEALMSSYPFETRLNWAKEFTFTAGYPEELQAELDSIFESFQNINSESENCQSDFENAGRRLLKVYVTISNNFHRESI